MVEVSSGPMVYYHGFCIQRLSLPNVNTLRGLKFLYSSSLLATLYPHNSIAFSHVVCIDSTSLNESSFDHLKGVLKYKI